MKTSKSRAGALLFILTACASLADTASKTPKWTAQPGKDTYFINSVAVSGDGSRVVGGTFYHNYGTTTRAEYKSTASTDSDWGTYGTYCYDQTGALLWKDEFDGYEGTYWVDISNNGAYAAAGGKATPKAGFVRAYAVAGTGQSRTRLLDYPTTARVNQVGLSADGTWLAAGAEKLYLFKRGSDGTYKLTGSYDAGSTVETIGISADGKRVIAGSYNSLLLVFDNTDGTLAKPTQWKLPSSYSHSIRLTPDGTTFVAGGPSGYVYYFDIDELKKTGKPTLSYQCPAQSAVYGVAVADDGSYFAGVCNNSSADKKGLVFYIQRTGSTGTLKWTYKTDRNPNCVSLNQATGHVAVADGHPDGTPGNFYLLDATSSSPDGSLIWQYGTGNMSWPIMISSKGNAIAAGSDDSKIYYFTP